MLDTLDFRLGKFRPVRSITACWADRASVGRPNTGGSSPEPVPSLRGEDGSPKPLILRGWRGSSGGGSSGIIVHQRILSTALLPNFTIAIIYFHETRQAPASREAFLAKTNRTRGLRALTAQKNADTLDPSTNNLVDDVSRDGTLGNDRLFGELGK